MCIRDRGIPGYLRINPIGHFVKSPSCSVWSLSDFPFGYSIDVYKRQLFYQRANAVASVVSLDVNPSIELKVNRSEKVLVCTPLNEDAKAILADMGNGADLKGCLLYTSRCV